MISASICKILAAFVLLIFPPAVSAEDEPDSVIEVGMFSQLSPGDKFPEGWKPLTFKNIEKPTEYGLVGENGKTVVKAVSEASASGLIREVGIDAEKYPWITWSWKIENVLEKGDVSRKQGDDYPARIYIAFEYDPDRLGFFEKVKYKAAGIFYGREPPHAAISYIWASKAPVGTIVPNPFTERVKMIVLESGGENTGQWQTHTRNVYEDYRKAFGETPPMISGIAIMTDSDNTGESAVAFYGDILFMTEPE